MLAKNSSLESGFCKLTETAMCFSARDEIVRHIANISCKHIQMRCNLMVITSFIRQDERAGAPSISVQSVKPHGVKPRDNGIADNNAGGVIVYAEQALPLFHESRMYAMICLTFSLGALNNQTTSLHELSLAMPKTRVS